MQQPSSAYKILGSASLGALSFLCLTSGLVYLPLSSAILVRVRIHFTNLEPPHRTCESLIGFALQIGGLAVFTVLLSYLLGKTSLTLSMVLSIVVVISGVVCACVPLWLHPDSRDPSVAGTGETIV